MNTTYIAISMSCFSGEEKSEDDRPSPSYGVSVFTAVVDGTLLEGVGVFDSFSVVLVDSSSRFLASSSLSL